MPKEKRNNTSIDLNIIQSCQKGEVKGQENFYKQYGPLVMSICLRYAANRTDAEDIFQEAFITIFEKIKHLKQADRLVSWIYKIIISKVVRFYRKKIQIEEVSDFNMPPGYIVQENEIIQALSTSELLALVQQLPTGYRLVFNLHIIEGFSHKEIAQMIGVTEATSRSQLFKAKQWLKKRIHKACSIPTYEK